MKIAGHPVHPLLVHFPSALLPMDVVLSILSHTSGIHVFSQAAFFCLAGGAGMGILTVLTGLLDLVHISRSNKMAITTVIYHAGLNGLVMVVFAVLAWKEWQTYPSLDDPGSGRIILKGILVLLLFAGNYFGGQLIYKYHTGIIKNLGNGKAEI